MNTEDRRSSTNDIYKASSQVALSVILLKFLHKKKQSYFQMAKLYTLFNIGNDKLIDHFPLENSKDKNIRRYYKKMMGIPETIFDANLDLSDLTKSQVFELSKWASSYSSKPNF